MRIAMVSYYLPSGSKIGVGYQAHELAQELTRRGHDVVMFSECARVDGAAYEHRRVHLQGSLRTFRFAAAVGRTDFSGFDVVHAHGDDYLLWRRSRRPRRHIRTLHGSNFEEALRIRGAREKLRMLLLGGTEVLATLVADVTVAVSPQTRRWAPWVTRVIPNGVDTTRFHPDPDAAAPTPTVLFVGTWSNRKRGGVLAEVFQREVLPAIPDARLEMVCRDAPENPGPGVKVLGALDDASLARAYQRAWAFCLPSEYEGFGIPYAEALATGTPVVATPNVGARYVTDDGRVGVLAPIDGLGDALRRLLQDGARRERLAEAGLERSRLFDLGAVAAAYEALYGSAAAGPER